MKYNANKSIRGRLLEFPNGFGSGWDQNLSISFVVVLDIRNDRNFERASYRRFKTGDQTRSGRKKGREIRVPFYRCWIA
jgi:hypothetical protein